MANRSNGREALRGAEVDTIDLIFEVLTSQQWADLLRAPLERAAATGNRNLAQKLVGAGAEIGDALHEAIGGGHGEIVSDLLESGALLGAKDKNGDTPLHIAAYEGETEMVQQLLLKGADKDKFEDEERTPLFLAADHGHLAAVLTLLTAGADVSLRCCYSKTPVLHAAAGKGHVEILRAVIEHGADVDAVDENYKHTALHVAAWYNKPGAIDVLVGAGANVDARGCLDYTPLHRASMELSREALRSLLKHGAAVNPQNVFLETPLMRALDDAEGHGTDAGVVDALLRAGADETLVDKEGRQAADLIPERSDPYVEDFRRVRELLANAPADRTWRRRGYLVLCRALPDRLQRNQVVRGTHHTGTTRRSRSYVELARAARVARDSVGDERTGGGGVLAKVLRLQEEGIFRTIVAYL